MPTRSCTQSRSRQAIEGKEQPDFSQGRRERRPVQTHEDAARGGERDAAAHFKQACRRPTERTRTSARARRPERKPGMETRNPSLWFALQGAGRHARFLAVAADAEYRDCSCSGAEREAESLACKCTTVRLPRTLMPNPSLKRSANGRPPGPRSRYGVHFLHRGPGVLPSAPA